MNTTIIPAGTYRLTRNVDTALLRDKRQRYNWTRFGSWCRGSNFEVKHDTIDGELLGAVSPITLVRLYAFGDRLRSLTLQRVRDGVVLPPVERFASEHKLAHTIFAACERVVEDFDDMHERVKARAHDPARAVVKALIATNKVTFDDVAALYARVEDDTIYDLIDETED